MALHTQKVVMAAIWFLLCTPPISNADPIPASAEVRLVQSGSIRFFGWDSDDPFAVAVLSGPGFDLSFSIPRTDDASNAGFITAHTATAFGTLDLADSVLNLGLKSFVTWRIATPIFPLDPGPGDLPLNEVRTRVYPFQFTATLFGQTTTGQSLGFNFGGQGMGSTDFFSVSIGEEELFIKPSSSTLVFASPASVPEPSSLLLLASATAIFGRQLKRRSPTRQR